MRRRDLPCKWMQTYINIIIIIYIVDWQIPIIVTFGWKWSKIIFVCIFVDFNSWNWTGTCNKIAVQRVVLHAVQCVVLSNTLIWNRWAKRKRKWHVSFLRTHVFFKKKTFLFTCVATRNSVSCSVNVLFLNTIQSLPIQIYFSDFTNW